MGRHAEAIPLTEAQQRLAAMYVPLAKSVLRPIQQMVKDQVHEAELESAAMLALVHAARAYDPAFDTQFSTYARHRILGALIDAHTSMRPKGYRSKAERPVVGPLSAWTESHIGRLFPARAEESASVEVDGRDFVEWCISRLPPKHGRVYRGLFVQDKTQAEIAHDLGLSQSEVCRLSKQARTMLADSIAARHAG